MGARTFEFNVVQRHRRRPRHDVSAERVRRLVTPKNFDTVIREFFENERVTRVTPTDLATHFHE
jgi:hypothetical protein